MKTRLLSILRRGVALALFIAFAPGPATPTALGQSADVEVHDPAMAEHDGTYYLFATGRGIRVWTSDDMENWERAPAVFDEAPTWAAEAVPNFNRRRNHLWAPDIAEHDGTFYLYYSVSSFGSNASAIGVATNATLDASDPGYEWVDQGMVVQSVPGRDLWNAIDPNLAFDDEGTPWLSFGSYWEGVKMAKMTADLTAVEENPQAERWRTVAARHRYWKLDERDGGDEMSGAIEAPFVFEKDGWYYLFVSWDQCCRDEESTYKIVVGRSRDITGPYVDETGEDLRFGGGTLVVKGNADWPGVGHNAAYTFDGTDYLVFHGYDASDDGDSKLWLEEIQWDAQGWPSVTLE